MLRMRLGLAWVTCVAMLGLGASPVAAQPSVRGQWSFTQPLPFFPINVLLLPTGKVMIYPGDEGISGDDPRLWDPATGTTTPLARVGYDLFCTGHSFLADGRVLIAGGHIQNNVGLPNASIYDPFTDDWTHMPDMNDGRWYPTNTTLANGDVLVVSGDIDSTVGVNRLPQVFQTASGTWRDLTGAQLSLDLYPSMHLAPNGRVFNSGPGTVTRYLETGGSGVWTAVANRVYGYRDYGSSVMYADGKVLVMGGGDPPRKSAEVIDLNAPTPAWRAVQSMAYARRQLNATLLPDGMVLVTGGTSGSGFNNPNTPVYAAEMWDPATEKWTTMASAQVKRLYHSAAVLLPDGRVLSTGGNGFTEAELYEPPYLFKGPRPTIGSAPGSVGYGQSFFVQTADATSITEVTWLRLGAVTHAFNMDQRISRLSFSQAGGGLDVVAPSSANLSPPGYYMLFLLNGNGVPSVAKILRIGGSAASPTLTVSATSVPAGGTITTTLQNGLGGGLDWLAVAPVGAPDTTYLQWTYVGAGVTTRTWTPPTPGPGTYEFRLFLNDGYTRAATSPAFTVTGGGGGNPTLTVSATSVPAGGTITTTLQNGFGGGLDWLAVAPVGAPDTTYLQWTYVGAGVTTRTWTPPTPGPGTYEFRLFLNDGYTRAATSPAFTVTGGASPTLTVSATSVPTGGTITTTLQNGFGGALDWLGLAPVGAPNTTYLQWTYVGAGVTTRTWTPPTPGPGTYEFRLFLNDGYTRAATSPAFTVTSP